jgi:hypothetical protein
MKPALPFGMPLIDLKPDAQSVSRASGRKLFYRWTLPASDRSVGAEDGRLVRSRSDRASH